MIKNLKEIWSRGVTLQGIIEGEHPGEGKPIITAEGPEAPCDGFYLRQEEWEYLPDLRERLHSGAWLAIGYRAPRRPDSQLEITPGEIAPNAEFYPAHSTIEGDGLRYVGVRLVSSSVLNDQPQTSKRGRPSHDSEIVAAYRDLISLGEIDFEAPLTHLFPKLRGRVAARLGIPLTKLKGVGDEAIRQRIRPLFDKDRPQKL